MSWNLVSDTSPIGPYTVKGKFLVPVFSHSSPRTLYLLRQDPSVLPQFVMFFLTNSFTYSVLDVYRNVYYRVKGVTNVS